MSAATVGYSFIPLVIALTGMARAPLISNGLISLGLLISYVPYLGFMHRRTTWSREYHRAVLKHSRSPMIAVMVITNFEFACFIAATKLIDISIAAVLFETWPILLVTYTMWLYRKSGRYQRITRRAVALMLVDTGGMVLTVAAENGTLTGLADADARNLIVGTLLALTGAGLSAGAGAAFRWGTDLTDHLESVGQLPEGRDTTEVVAAVTASLLANSFIVPLNIGLGLLLGESLGWGPVGAAAMAAAVCHGGSTILWRKANLLSESLAVNTICYMTPVLALLMLFAFGEADVRRPDLLALGTAAIIGANVMIQVRPVRPKRDTSQEASG